MRSRKRSSVPKKAQRRHLRHETFYRALRRTRPDEQNQRKGRGAAVLLRTGRAERRGMGVLFLVGPETEADRAVQAFEAMGDRASGYSGMALRRIERHGRGRFRNDRTLASEQCDRG